MAIWKSKDKVLNFLTKFLPVVPHEKTFDKKADGLSQTKLMNNAKLSTNDDMTKCLNKILETQSRLFRIFDGPKGAKFIHLTEEGAHYRNVISDLTEEISVN